MITDSILAGLLLGLDSFFICLAIGTLPERAVQRGGLAVSFGMCDGLASLIGVLFGIERLHSWMGWSEWIGPAAVAAYAGVVFYFAYRCHQAEAIPDAARWFAFGLPMCLSLDNLVTVVDSHASAWSALFGCAIIGFLSSGLAYAGLRLGNAASAGFHLRSAWMSGSALVSIAVFMFLKENVFNL
jgi:putative Mn2+ efflux pump MntP